MTEEPTRSRWWMSAAARQSTQAGRGPTPRARLAIGIAIVVVVGAAAYLLQDKRSAAAATCEELGSAMGSVYGASRDGDSADVLANALVLTLPKLLKHASELAGSSDPAEARQGEGALKMYGIFANLETELRAGDPSAVRTAITLLTTTMAGFEKGVDLPDCAALQSP